MNNPQITVIVAVYQAEKWMRRCLDSIAAQSFTNWECILVDDGSTDGSGAVCDEYAVRDSRFRVMHKENGGVSSARQAGLDNARGTYVIHADPDDYTHPDWLKNLYDKAIDEDADMTVCDIEVIPQDGSPHYNIPGCFHSTDAIDLMEDILNREAPPSASNKLVKKECFDKHHISFPIGIDYAEDLYVSCHLIDNITKIAYVQQTLYYYDKTQCENSLTKIVDSRQVSSFKFVIDSLQDILHDKKYGEELQLMYNMKRDFKEFLVIMHGKRPFDIQKTYPEINVRYLDEMKGAKFLSQRYGIALARKGHYALGRFIFNSAIWIKDRMKRLPFLSERIK